MAGLSQPEMASQGSQGGPLFLDLAKYSYATLPMNSGAPVPWIHLSNTVSLVAFFETRRSLSAQGDVLERSVFKVLKDPEIMEEIDLQALARESQLAMERSNDGDHSKEQNVAVITKAPVIAIKYPLNEREVRRFQIRFQSDEHYYEAMKHFSRAGVRPVEAGTFPSRPRTTASNSSLSVATTAPTTQATFVSSRPATAASYSTVGTTSPTVQRPSTCSSGLMPPPFHASGQHSGGERIVAPPIYSDNIHKRPNSSSLGACRILASGPVSSSVNVVTSSTPRVGETVSLINQGNSAIGPYVPRPSTVPEKSSHNLSQILPPRRELPFEKKADISREKAKDVTIPKTTTAEPGTRSVSGKEGNNGTADARLGPEGSPPSARTRRRPARRAASTTKSAAAKKSVSTKKGLKRPNLKTSPMRGQPDLMVPSIEEHLQKAQVPAHKKTTQEDTQEDTQALLERAATRLQKTATGLQKSITQSLAASDVAGGDNDTGPVVDAHIGAQSDAAQDVAVADAPIPTGNNKIDAISTVTAAHNTGDSRSSSGSSSSGKSTAVEGVAKAYSQLIQQPEFANSEDKMEGWANGLSGEEQKAAIDKFICDAYQDKRFWNLCRMLEGRVDAMIVWPPRGLRNPEVQVTVDDDGD